MREHQLIPRTHATQAGLQRKTVTFYNDRSLSAVGRMESMEAQEDQEGIDQHPDVESVILHEEIYQISVSDVD